MSVDNIGPRREQLWVALSTVVDPELDQPVTDLGFITCCNIDADYGVDVEYRLPTYWCAANFAFMMGHDLVDAIDSLDWPAWRRVRLLDHFYAEQINRGLADNADFQTTCDGEAADDLITLRATFRHKAFMARQERLLDHLIRFGWTAEEIVALSVADLVAMAFDESRGVRLRDRYLAMRQGFTPGEFNAAGYRSDAIEVAFVTATGAPLTTETLDGHRQRLRSVRMNSEFNAVMCTSVLAARKRESDTPLTATESAEENA